MLRQKPTKQMLVLLPLLVLIIPILYYVSPAWPANKNINTISSQKDYSYIYQGDESKSSNIGSQEREAFNSHSMHHDISAQEKADSESERSTQEKTGTTNVWLTLLALFLGGLALNLTPCVYPLIPITVSYFGGKSERIRGHTIVHGIVYMFGLAMTNSLLGLSAALSGGMLGFALQNPFVLIFVAGVMVAMSLSFFSVWELRAPFWLTRLASKNYAGFFGTFFMGLTLGIVAAPCIGPFILGLLIYVGQTGDPFLGFLYFFVLSIGLGLPLSVLAVFSGVITRLPKSGDWMLWIRKLMGWILLCMAAFMISPLIAHFFAKQWLLAGVSVAAGIHLGWLDTTGKKLKIFPYFKKIVGIIAVVGGIIYLALTYQHAGKIEWIPYDQSILENAAEEKKQVIIDFYADWCGPCVAMEREVFSDPEVIKLSRDVITMRLDLSRSQPYHDEIMKKYQIRGIPTAVFINHQGIEEESLRAIGFVYKDEFLKRLRSFLAQSPSGPE